MDDGHLSRTTARGRVTIAADAVAQIAGRTVAQCYGVVAMAPRGRAPVGRLLDRGRLTRGIVVGGGSDGLTLDLHVVVEYGLNLAEVASPTRSQVAYEVERLTGLRIASVDVHIRDVRRSA